RQLISRETAGADVTIVCDIPLDSDLGALAAADVAVALAMMPENSELEPPMRARISDVCAHAVDTFSSLPSLPARHTAALRTEEGSVSFIDYAGYSVTKAAASVSGASSLSILCPADTIVLEQIVEIQQRR